MNVAINVAINVWSSYHPQAYPGGSGIISERNARIDGRSLALTSSVHGTWPPPGTTASRFFVGATPRWCR